jgi:hypothetical protein
MSALVGNQIDASEVEIRPVGTKLFGLKFEIISDQHCWSEIYLRPVSILSIKRLWHSKIN